MKKKHLVITYYKATESSENLRTIHPNPFTKVVTFIDLKTKDDKLFYKKNMEFFIEYDNALAWMKKKIKPAKSKKGN